MDDKTLDNLRDRARIKIACEADINKQAAALELCKRDIVHFFKYHLFTFDPRQSPADLPFNPWPYQEDYIRNINQDIANGDSSVTEKTRDMGVTWMVLAVFLYRWLFFNENFLLGSKKQEDVDTIGKINTHFERIRYMLSKLPDWMVEQCEFRRIDSNYMRIYKANGASLIGESMNPSFSRQGRFKAILLDEFAFVDQPEVIWRACGDSAPCKIAISTPNGSNNFFAHLRKQQHGEIKVYTLHWKLHPFKDDAWYEAEKAKRSAKDVAQELDINYTISAGQPFYVGFSRGIHVRKMLPNRNRELVLGWDYGFIHPNCVVTQLLPEGIWLIVDNILGENMTIDEFGEDVKAYLNQYYSEFKFTETCYGDPAGKQASDKSRHSSEEILNRLGFRVKSIPSNSHFSGYASRKQLIEKRLRTLIGGIPSLVVNDVPNNQIIIEGFEGGYRYPDANKYGGVAEKPIDDGWFEHPFNALEYVAINLFRKLDIKERAPIIANRMDIRGKVPFKRENRQPVNAGIAF
jgi:hypothetical protein